MASVPIQLLEPRASLGSCKEKKPLLQLLDCERWSWQWQSPYRYFQLSGVRSVLPQCVNTSFPVALPCTARVSEAPAVRVSAVLSSTVVGQLAEDGTQPNNPEQARKRAQCSSSLQTQRFNSVC
ncbi:hypothetical protein AGIG_G14315 [Arapaima gigas]